MQTFVFDVGDMTCGGCTGSVQRAIGKIDGVGRTEVTLRPGVVTIKADPTHATGVGLKRRSPDAATPPRCTRQGTRNRRGRRQRAAATAIETQLRLYFSNASTNGESSGPLEATASRARPSPRGSPPGAFGSSRSARTSCFCAFPRCRKTCAASAACPTRCVRPRPVSSAGSAMFST